MKSIKVLMAIGVLVLSSNVFAQDVTTPVCVGGGLNFVDLNGDGINDNALDSDGDGIPNGLDSDYQAALNGTGRAARNNGGQGVPQGAGLRVQDGTCPATGTQSGMRLRDGSGAGLGRNATGTCRTITK